MQLLAAVLLPTKNVTLMKVVYLRKTHNHIPHPPHNLGIHTDPLLTAGTWEDNIKKEHKGTVHDDVNFMQLALEIIQWHALVDTEFNPKVPKKMVNIFSCWVEWACLMELVVCELTVSGELRLQVIWKKMRSSPAIMYDTPYPSSATGPKPPPAEMQLGYFFKSSFGVCPCGVWDVDNRHGSLSTSLRNGESTSRYLDTT
jgi:hypothetical protein